MLVWIPVEEQENWGMNMLITDLILKDKQETSVTGFLKATRWPYPEY